MRVALSDFIHAGALPENNLGMNTPLLDLPDVTLQKMQNGSLVITHKTSKAKARIEPTRLNSMLLRYLRSEIFTKKVPHV